MFAGFAVIVGRGTLLSAPMPLVMFALAAAATALFLKKTQWGTYIYAIGDNPWLKLRPESESAVLDRARLRTYLDTRGFDLDLGTAPRQFAGGLGNLNFLLSIDGRPCVLRRPPFGDIPRGANDMAREHRVLGTLWRAYPCAPQSLLYCADPGVIGAHFLVMSYQPGPVIGGQLPPGFTAQQVGPRSSASMVRLLATLHAVQTQQVGLAEFGRPEGFLRRTCEGWAERARRVSQDTDDPAHRRAGAVAAAARRAGWRADLAVLGLQARQHRAGPDLAGAARRA